MAGEDKAGSQSGFRYEALREVENTPAPSPDEPAEKSVKAEGPYAALVESHARVVPQLQAEKEFGSRIGDVVAIHEAKDSSPPPMQREAPSPEQLRQPSMQGRSVGGDVEYTPFGPKLHLPHSHPQERVSPGERKLEFPEDRERGSGEKTKDTEQGQKPGGTPLQFFEDKNPTTDHDRDR